jgi:putative oxidoreductase
MPAIAVTRALSHFTFASEWLKPPVALLTRVYVGWQFFKSGWFSVTDWETTTSLFTDMYKVPLPPPIAAAVLGTFAELVLPVFLALGLGGRAAAFGLFLVNIVAVISYPDLMAEGFESALGWHYLWGFMLLMLTAYGPGAWSLDRWLDRKRPEGQRWS